VLVWWGHAAHGKVEDAVVERVLSRIWEGMGFIALHSAHYSKVFNAFDGHKLLAHLAGRRASANGSGSVIPVTP
jgi:trehalose utilization protein